MINDKIYIPNDHGFALLIPPPPPPFFVVTIFKMRCVELI